MSERRYDTPPRNKASLEQRLRNLIGGDALQLRARRQIGYIAVIAALDTHARDENGESIFAVKGGLAVELLGRPRCPSSCRCRPARPRDRRGTSQRRTHARHPRI
jgi:hypothetical protein